VKRVTKKQYEYFCGRVKYWMQDFGITGWTVFFLHQDLQDSSAEIRYTYSERAVTFALPWYVYQTTRKVLDETALHEVIHLVLAPLDVMAKCRYIEEREIQDVVEGTTCRLTNFIMKLRGISSNE